jgi:hypothetical protein
MCGRYPSISVSCCFCFLGDNPFSYGSPFMKYVVPFIRVPSVSFEHDLLSACTTLATALRGTMMTPPLWIWSVSSFIVRVPKPIELVWEGGKQVWYCSIHDISVLIVRKGLLGIRIRNLWVLIRRFSRLWFQKLTRVYPLKVKSYPYHSMAYLFDQSRTGIDDDVRLALGGGISCRLRPMCFGSKVVFQFLRFPFCLQL